MQHIFDRLWDAYAAITPQARRVRELLAERGETVRTDHIAFRTFDLAPIDLEHLAKPWESKDWVRTGEYRFEAKKLRAVSPRHRAAPQLHAQLSPPAVLIR